MNRKRKILQSSLVLSLVCLVSHVAGCESLPPSTKVGALEYGADAKCADDSQCADGDSCLAGRCANAVGESYEIALKLTYPDAVDAPVTVYRDFVPGESLGTFTRPELLTGTMTIAFLGGDVAGTAVFTPHDAWNGIENAHAFSLSQGKTEYAVYPGKYDIVFYPASTETETLPVMIFDDISIENSGQELRFRVENPRGVFPQSENVWWSQMIAATFEIAKTSSKEDEKKPGDHGNGSGESAKEDNAALEGAAFRPQVQFRIVDADFGIISTQYSMDLSDKECVFYLPDFLLPPQRSTRRYVFKLVYQLTPFLQLTQTIGEFISEFDSPGGCLGVCHMNSTLNYVIDGWKSRSFKGQIMAPSAITPANGTVSITATDAEGKIQWKTSAQTPTSSDGYFVFDYPDIDCEVLGCQMSYKVDVSYDDDHALASESFVFDALEDLKAIPVKPKTAVAGTVYSHNGKPLSQVTVSFKPRNTDSSAVIETQTDVNGYYNVRLNHRLYDVAFIPVKSSGVSQEFSRLDVSDLNEIEYDFSFRRPNLVYGNIVDSEYHGIEGVRLDAYIRTEDGVVRRVASSESDADGVFRLFVPSRESVIRGLSLK